MNPAPPVTRIVCRSSCPVESSIGPILGLGGPFPNAERRAAPPAHPLQRPHHHPAPPIDGRSAPLRQTLFGCTALNHSEPSFSVLEVGNQRLHEVDSILIDLPRILSLKVMVQPA